MELSNPSDDYVAINSPEDTRPPRRGGELNEELTEHDADLPTVIYEVRASFWLSFGACSVACKADREILERVVLVLRESILRDKGNNCRYVAWEWVSAPLFLLCYGRS